MASMAATALLFLLATVPAVLAVTFKVGDTAGWTTGVDYTAWVKGKTFRVGDFLEFEYSLSHSLSVVDKAGYDGCDNSGATQNFADGDTKINLTKVGTMHFLCPVFGHCLGGMKLAVPVLAASPSPSTPSSPPSPPAPPSKSGSSPPPRSPPKIGSSPPPSSSPAPAPNDMLESDPLTPSVPPPKPNVASKEVMSYGMIGAMMVFMFGVMT